MIDRIKNIFKRFFFFIAIGVCSCIYGEEGDKNKEFSADIEEQLVWSRVKNYIECSPIKELLAKRLSAASKEDKDLQDVCFTLVRASGPQDYKGITKEDFKSLLNNAEIIKFYQDKIINLLESIMKIEVCKVNGHFVGVKFEDYLQAILFEKDRQEYLAKEKGNLDIREKLLFLMEELCREEIISEAVKFKYPNLPVDKQRKKAQEYIKYSEQKKNLENRNKYIYSLPKSNSSSSFNWANAIKFQDNEAINEQIENIVLNKNKEVIGEFNKASAANKQYYDDKVLSLTDRVKEIEERLSDKDRDNALRESVKKILKEEYGNTGMNSQEQKEEENKKFNSILETIDALKKNDARNKYIIYGLVAFNIGFLLYQRYFHSSDE